ncbi:hypothetical protein HQN86_10495 [Pedobacter panaciterrae]|uniref:hypothetical protein n=1 Tax=Pedobacter panaciterrae TaxID=363849 RepID=UPI00155DCE30|nr:hypothetical protein [Pedobacter panaciterrae]NQX54045.1 hypothetical protein [Pedobacter panaciterrae]
MEIITQSSATATINAPAAAIDITDWLFKLSDLEYQACSKAHVACGSTMDINGKRVSINVENVAGNLLVQHYQEEISERSNCRVNSISDSFSELGVTKLGITWELTINRLTEKTSELENKVTILITDEFGALLKRNDTQVTDAIKLGMSKNVAEHNLEETPLFAKDIERKALSGQWA